MDPIPRVERMGESCNDISSGKGKDVKIGDGKLVKKKKRCIFIQVQRRQHLVLFFILLVEYRTGP